MEYVFKTSLGILRIKTHDDKYRVWLNDDWGGPFISAQQAVGDVYDHAIGVDEWDSSDISAPESLDGWTKVL